MQVIEPFDQNDYLIECELDDQTYFMHLSWNSEAGIWVMGVEDANEQVILQGVVLVANSWLTQQFRSVAIPPGDFIVYAENPNEIIDRMAFLEGRATLYYITQEEYENFPVGVVA
jgi:hypothetical protein